MAAHEGQGCGIATELAPKLALTRPDDRPAIAARSALGYRLGPARQICHKESPASTYLKLMDRAGHWEESELAQQDVPDLAPCISSGRTGVETDQGRPMGFGGQGDKTVVGGSTANPEAIQIAYQGHNLC